MKRAVGLFVLLAACAEPLALRVDVLVQREDLESIQLVVQREDGSTVTDCAILASGTNDCGFEASKTSWTGTGTVAFILYGDDASKIAVEARGRVGETTVARATGEGTLGEGAVTLTLRPRAAVHRRCELDVGSMGPAGMLGGAIGLLGVRPGEYLLVVAGGPMWQRVSYAVDDAAAGGCTITTEMTFTGCISRGDVLVGNVDSRPRDELIVTCGEPPRLHALDITGMNPASDPLGDATRLSSATLADIDGDGFQEVHLLRAVGTSSATRGLELLSWSPGASAPRVTPLVGLFPATRGGGASATIHADLPPVLVAVAQGEGVIVMGYGGGNALVTRNGVNYDRALRGRVSSSGVSAARTMDGVRTAFVRVDMMVPKLVLADLDGATPNEPTTLPERPRVNRSIVPMFGEVGGGPPRFVLVGSERIYAVNPISGAVETQPVTGLSPNRAIEARLANIDGARGAEVITYDDQTATLLAYRLGNPAPLFTETSVGSTGSTTRIVLADLDGDDALEVIVFSAGRLQILSLGVGSYDPMGLPWPSERRDRAGSSFGRSESDPHAR